ncbi:MAG TPA: ABC transporter substrate-binding protein [Chloroflexota bacterium]|nr:ABC transporter substrate-binding protein [Chloroflexota bacterium]
MHRVTLIGNLASALLLGGVACAPAGPAPAAVPPAAAAAPAPSDAVQPLVDAARQEGELLLVWGENTMSGSEGAQRLAAAFNARYGLSLSVQFTPGPPMPEVATRLIQEYKAQRRASTDVFVGPESAIRALEEGDTLEPVDWMSWAPHIQDPRLIAPGNVAVELISSTIGITYNSAKLTGAAVPTSLQDLLKPEYKGRIASTVYAAIFPELASPELWGEQRVRDYLRRLADQVAGLIRCGENERVLSGEFDLYALDCGSYQADLERMKGLPLAQAVPTDAALLFHWYVGVPKNAAHPNAAKLFIDWLLSREGQDIVWETQAADHHLVPGSKVAPRIAQLQAQGVKFTELNLQFAERANAEEQDRLRTEFQAILRKQ